MSRNTSIDDEKYEESAIMETQGIAFDLESNKGASGQKRPRRLSMHRRLSESSFQEKVSPEKVLPIAFKTFSHTIDDAESAVKKEELPQNVKQLADQIWHIVLPDVVEKELHTSMAQGLTAVQYMESKKTYGANVQSKPPKGLLRKIFFYFFGGFGTLLMVGGILCCIAWKPLGDPPAVANVALGVVLFIVFLAQAAFNFIQDFSSSRVMDSINSVMPSETKILRNGQIQSIDSKDLVPGDIVILEMGSKVSGDVRIFEHSPDLSFDRSVLTGELKPIKASTKPYPSGYNYLEAECIAMQGTFCVMGTGRGIVVATGDNTVFGQIAKASAAPVHGLSPLQKEILRFVLITVSIIIALVVLVCILWGAWIKKSYPDWISVPTLIVDIVSVAVAFIPEGLPISLTTCLIITAGVMKKNQILCKSLSAVETLGSVSVLCSDKTGTLTKNQMHVTDSTLGADIIQPYFMDDIDEKQEPIQNIDGISHIHTVAALCNAGVFDPTTLHLPLKERKIQSNATDQAILRFAEAIFPSDQTRSSWKMLAELPFNSKVKFMGRLYQPINKIMSHDLGVPDEYDLFTVKGAPDILLDRCSHVLSGSTKIPLTSSIIENISSIQREWANSGKRVVLLASRIVKKPEAAQNPEFWFDSDAVTDHLTNLSASNLTLVGLVGIADPPKDDIPDVVNTLRGAGIKLAMVTGDFELTAVAIARLCGIVTAPTVDVAADLRDRREFGDPKLSKTTLIERAVVVNNKDINGLTDEEWQVLTCYQEIVFARATPEQKLRIVEKFQSQGNIVGMTGDGVNDAPSLKKADVGIAMADGSDIAKEAADIVLLQSFSSIVDALKYGILVFENLRKTIAYLLPAGTYAELWPVLLNVIFGLPQALSSFNMILICCLTDCAGAITIAYEKPEKNLLTKKPRSITGERLVDWKLFLHSYFTIGTYYTFTSMLMCFINFQRNGIQFSKLTLSYGNFQDIDPDKVASVGNVSSSIYFINLVIMQFFNLMAVRTRSLSMFQQPPIMNKATRNHLMFFAMLFALAVTFFFNYIPWFQKNLNTAHVPVEYYFTAIGFGAIVLIYDETRKYFVRKYPNSILARMAW